MTVVVLGAAGFTGRLVLAELARRGVPFLPAVRDPSKVPGAVRADARDARSVAAAIRGASALVNVAGPFTSIGDAPARAALAARVPYLDSTGEQAHLRALRALDEPARVACVPLAPAFAYEYALGDAAARLALERAPDATALHVLYRTRAPHASAGTKRSIVRVAADAGLSRVDGHDVREGLAAARRTFATEDGPRTGVSFPGGEAVQVPRWSSVPTVRTYLALRPSRARQARLAGAAARAVLRGPLLAAAERLAVRDHRDPTPDERAATGYEVLAEAETPRGVVRVALVGSDPYATTARLLVAGAAALARSADFSADDDAEGQLRSQLTGFLAPTEVLDAQRLVEIAGARVVA